MPGARTQLVRKSLVVIAILIVTSALYLLTWPVPVEPVAWNAPESAGYSGDFVRNHALAEVELIDLSPHRGPEDIALGRDGALYTGTAQGAILRLVPGSRATVFANTGGRPLGLEFDAGGGLIVANAYFGLQRVEVDGTVMLLTDSVGGSPIRYADDLDITPDGRIYFSDASTKFGAAQWTGTYSASLLDIMEHGAHGRVLVYDPQTGVTGTVIEGLNFANGIAADPAGRYLLVNETGSYRVLRHWLAGARAGETEVLIDNLPGFPDNINRGLDGRFWIGLIAPRSPLLDKLSARPLLRKIAQRLPASLRPRAEPYSHLFAIDGDGIVQTDLQGDGARLPAVTGALETPNGLFLSSLFGTAIGRIPMQ